MRFLTTVLVVLTGNVCDAVNSYVVPSSEFLVGASGQIEVRCDNDVRLLGYSFGVTYDPAVLSVSGVTNAGTVAEAADYFDGRIDAVGGRVAYGALLDLDGVFDQQFVPAGQNQLIALLDVDVLALTDTVTTIAFEDVAINPDFPVFNVMTNDSGFSITPILQDGVITIREPSPPNITGFQDNSGQEGSMFVVLGTDFNEDGLRVRVCGTDAVILSMLIDGTAITAAVPNCDALGLAEVQVCTVNGCDSDPEGFFYEFAGPRFIRADCNGDGTVDGTADAIFLLKFLFADGAKWPCFAACDVNGDLLFDISDAVFLLLASFMDGAPPPAPFPECGPGDEGSFLAGCETEPVICR